MRKSSTKGLVQSLIWCVALSVSACGSEQESEATASEALAVTSTSDIVFKHFENPVACFIDTPDEQVECSRVGCESGCAAAGKPRYVVLNDAYGECSGSERPRSLDCKCWSLAPCGVMNPNDTLVRGATLKSCNGRYALVHQPDGNVVQYGPKGAMWSSKTYGQGSDTLVMQPDGNLVLYANGMPIWATYSHNNLGAFFTVQDDGNMVVYGPYGTNAIWASRRPR